MTGSLYSQTLEYYKIKFKGGNVLIIEICKLEDGFHVLEEPAVSALNVEVSCWYPLADCNTPQLRRP
jgi:hypothetical protein